MNRAWSRLPEEPENRYLAFLHYLAQGSSSAKRDLGETARAVHVRPAVVADWMRLHQWQDRSRAFDASAATDVLDDIRQQRSEFIRRHVAISRAAQGVAETALRHITTAQAEWEGMDADERGHPPVSRATDVKALVDMAATAEAHAAEMARGNKVAGSADEVTSVDVSRLLSDPALLERALALGDDLAR